MLLVNVQLNTKYGIYANIFAEKMWVATHIFSATITVN